MLGADVTHPAAGEITRPSIAAIVGSLDPVPCKFVVSISKISHFLDGILIEHIDTKSSVDSKLQIYSICSIRTRSRKQDILEKPQQLNSNPSVVTIYTLVSIPSPLKQVALLPGKNEKSNFKKE